MFTEQFIKIMIALLWIFCGSHEMDKYIKHKNVIFLFTGVALLTIGITMLAKQYLIF
jgi:hypothetical protein